MFDALYIGATGMQAQQLHVDTIANNLANMNTTAYKKGRISFADLVAGDMSRAAAPSSEETLAVALLGTPRSGVGVGVVNVSKQFDTGELKKTDSPLDIAIQGEGFLEVTMPDGSRAFTRGGALKLNRDGVLVTQAGYPLRPGITIPENAQAVTVTAAGQVQVKVPGQAKPVEVGQLEMVRFNSPGLLAVLGDNLYGATAASGEPSTAQAGQEGMGTLVQGFVEGSNVRMVDEMVNLMLAQRAYEASVKVVQASDEMLGLVNNLRK